MHVIDSHTEGEPTRLIVDGGPELGSGTMRERLEYLSLHHDAFRRRVILEPRGNDAMVGALLCESNREDCDAGVIFFNNAGYLSMCGHGAIGTAVTLAYLKRVALGPVNIETPAGVVVVNLRSENEATVENVPSYCYRRDVQIEVANLGTVSGDIAWGGNWFFLVNSAPFELTLRNQGALSRAALAIRHALKAQGLAGKDGGEIDHIEFFGPPVSRQANSRNFVLCPGGAYDRSPCGTGTSAKLACLAERGELAAGQEWIQESIIGSGFVASFRHNEQGQVIASITGRAYVVAEANLIFNPQDPFLAGIE